MFWAILPSFPERRQRLRAVRWLQNLCRAAGSKLHRPQQAAGVKGMIVPVSEQRRGRQVRIEPVEYANGWAANVEIDGIVLQTDSDAVALCVTREEAIAQGEQRAREFLQQH